uniref:Uncharacterized protein n=1 Tax=Caenorhabditis japonica TaxID=281687 RepID=A0A8R1HZI8_CAEJA
MKPSAVFTVLLLIIFLNPTVSQDNRDDSNTDTTTSDGFDCIWLDTNFTYNKWSSNLVYNGTCCSRAAIKALNESSQYSWLVDGYNNNPDLYNRWDALTNLLFCIPGACTEPNPAWINCSG